MGADLYLESRFRKPHERWRKRFEKAVARRDAAPAGSAEGDRLQRVVLRCYDRMFRNGYFRDSYNQSNLLWQFELSWWEDVIPMLDGNSELAPARTQELLSMLEGRLADFERNIGERPPDEQRYFRKKWRQLRHFLMTAIALGEPIGCSL
jgi:hypothetical protein